MKLNWEINKTNRNFDCLLKINNLSNKIWELIISDFYNLMNKFNMNIDDYNLVTSIIPDSGSLLIFPSKKDDDISDTNYKFSLGIIDESFQNDYCKIELDESLSDNEFDRRFNEMVREKKILIESYKHKVAKSIFIIVLDQDLLEIKTK